jgi:RNA 2',3'-cyclic 3'-phosphodiesterase
MSVLRLFIAIELSSEIQAGLQQVEKNLQMRLGALPVRWVPVKNIHLTLVFLGDVVATQVGAITDMLRSQVAGQPLFELAVAGLGAFPSPRKPRVVWIGVSAPPDLSSLQHRLAQGTARLGYPPEERPFSPHLTLGRVGKNASPDEVLKIGEILSVEKVETLGKMAVTAVNLYSSDLQPSGAVYSRVFSASLQ